MDNMINTEVACLIFARCLLAYNDFARDHHI
nr:MAG TPA: hypothetical protein [Caudoviricetes sp.]